MAHYLISGATGVLGSHIFRSIFNKGHQVTLMLRGRTEEERRARLKELVLFYNLPQEAVDQVRLLHFDLSRPHLDMNLEEAKETFSSADHFIHSAASVRLNQTPEQARTMAIHGTKKLLEFCERWGFPNHLKKVEYISTVGVGGKTFSELPEAFIHETRDFHNNYEMAKSESEDFIEQKILQGLPITVHRPSMIIGNTYTGAILHFHIFYTLIQFLSGQMTGGFLPTLGQRKLDVIPVDFVSHAITSAAIDQNTRGKVLHLCSGPEYSIPLLELSILSRTQLSSHHIKLPALKWIPQVLALALSKATTYLPKHPATRTLKSLPHFLNYLSTKQEFLNTDTKAWLKTHNLAVPTPEAYLPAVFDYWIRRTHE